MFEIIKNVNPNDVTGYMNATELYEALIKLGLTDSDEYQVIAQEINHTLELHPNATMDEIAEAFIDDILDLEDALGDLEVETLVVEDYAGTDRGFQDLSYVLGYRIRGAYTCKCGAHFVKTENHNYCGNCGAKI